MSERAKLPAGMDLRKTSPRPNQAYDVLLDDAMVGTCEHQEGWSARKYWLFTDIEGTQIWVAEKHNYNDGAAWLKSAYQDSSPVAPAPVGHGGGPGFETDQRRKKKVEEYAVAQIMACFPAPLYQARHVGDSKPGYDIEVTTPAGEVWHIEAKGTRGECGTVHITERERVHPSICQAPVHALCVVSGIKATPVAGTYECSGGTPEWLWPWTITQKPGDPGLRPVEYLYTVPEDRYTGQVPPPV
jgi:hypothetical protein